MTPELIQELYDAFGAATHEFEDAGLTPIALIDRYRGQPQNPEQFEYYPLPAIFLSNTKNWFRAGNCWNADMQLNFHLVTEPTWDMSNIATNHLEGLEYYRLVEAVRKVLDNFSSDRTARLERESDQEADSGVVMYSVLVYKTIFYGNDVATEEYTDSGEDQELDVVEDVITIQTT